MVGQMISLNQLDQLISINQIAHRVHRHSNDGVGTTSGCDGQRCCALFSEWRPRQQPFRLRWQVLWPTNCRSTPIP